MLNCFYNVAIFNASMAVAIFVTSYFGEKNFSKLSSRNFSLFYIAFALVELLCVAIILFCALQYLACDKLTNCPEEKYEFTMSTVSLVIFYSAISCLGLIHGTIQARYISHMPDLQSVPRTMQTTAFF